jgi:cation diffusion facilitator CzcD-associated flavoprotein CzcO
MIQINNKNTQNLRVLNLSDRDIPGDRVLTLDSESVDTMVSQIRRYADQPFVYIVSKKRSALAMQLLSALKALHSPCYPYALFSIDGAELTLDEADLDIISIDGADANEIQQRVFEYASNRFAYDKSRLKIDNQRPLPTQVDVVVVGAGITGLYAANRLREEGLSYCVVEKRDMIGGIWTRYANTTSQVNSSECAYRLFDKPARSNRDHSFTREILEDIEQLSKKIANHLFLETTVENIAKKENRYCTRLNRSGEPFVIESTGLIVAVNDRVGEPRKIEWENQPAFQGTIVSGFSDKTKDVEWRNKNVVVLGMGAFAIENARTALEAGARHVTVVCRRHGTVCPKIIDYLNFATPYDDAYLHDNKSNIRNMMYWKKLYQLSGATQPECWMGKVKHEGHTISVSDIWFVGHYLKKIETITGKISQMTENGVVVDGHGPIDADIVVNCIGFERNTQELTRTSSHSEMYNNNYVDQDFMYLADAYIDDDAFNSLFGSSVLEMVKFYVEVYLKLFDSPEYDTMMAMDGIEKISVHDRKWSHYIRAAMALIRDYPVFREIAKEQVDRRTDRFLTTHDLETYIAQNKREWIDMHGQLAGSPMTEEECLPYIFDRLLPKNK